MSHQLNRAQVMLFQYAVEIKSVFQYIDITVFLKTVRFKSQIYRDCLF